MMSQSGGGCCRRSTTCRTTIVKSNYYRNNNRCRYRSRTLDLFVAFGAFAAVSLISDPASIIIGPPEVSAFTVQQQQPLRLMKRRVLTIKAVKGKPGTSSLSLTTDSPDQGDVAPCQPSTLSPGATTNNSVPTETTAAVVSFGDVVELRPREAQQQQQRQVPSTDTTVPAIAAMATTAAATTTASQISTLRNTVGAASSSTATAATTTIDEVVLAQEIRKRNAIAAILGIALALSQWFYQWFHPLEPIQLLFEMQQQSPDITVIGTNNKPTVIDFWAPWCENCKLMAPTMKQIEMEYGANNVNFILVNGDLPSSYPLIDAFHVDAIPHIAFVEADGTVDTALIGPIPKRIITANIDVLIANSQVETATKTTTTATLPKSSPTSTDAVSSDSPETITDLKISSQRQELPYKMLDVFAGQPESARRIQF